MIDLPPLVWVLIIYAIIESVLDGIKKAPLWLLRRFVGSLHRSIWGELSYLRALTKDPDLKRWAHEYATLQAIKARPVKERAQPKPLLSLLQSYVEQGQQVVVVGEPGAGKTTILEALTYELALRAYRRQLIASGMFLGLILLILITSRSPLPALLLLTMPLFEFLFRRWPLPVFIQLRRFEGDSVENLLKGTVSGWMGGGALSKALRNYVERSRLVWLLDGIDEVEGGAYESALDGWRECLGPDQYLARAPVIFTSRPTENPADSLGLEEVLEVVDLDDEGVGDFLVAYGSENVIRDFASLVLSHTLGERGLGRNPYWLKMMVQTGLYTRNRGTLFEAFASLLIQRELDKGLAQPQHSIVPMEHQMEALGYLAYTLSNAGRVSLALDRAEEKLDRWLRDRELEWKPSQVLEEAEATTLMRLSQRKNRAEFGHQLVQKFFTAYALRLHPDDALLHVHDHRWWETLLMLGGLVDDHSALVRKVLGDGRDSQRLFLAVGLLWSVDRPGEELQHQVIASVADSMRRGLSEACKLAAVQLASIAGDGVTKVLGELLEEEDQAVKMGAVELLREIGSRDTAQVLTASLADEAIASHATAALVSIGELAVEPLIEELQNWRLRPKAAQALGRIGESAVGPLVEALRDEDWNVRTVAATILEQIGEPAVEPLIAALGAEDELVRGGAASALGRIGDARAVEPLIAALRDEHESVRWAAVWALEEIGELAVELLVKALRDEDVLVRKRAVGILGQIGDARAVQPLIDALQDRVGEVSEGAAEALGNIGDAQAVEPLIAALRDESRKMRRVAAEALERIGEPAVDRLISALGSDSESLRGGAAEALGQIGDAWVLEPLMGMLQDESWWVRQRVAEALGRIGDARALEPLIAALGDEAGWVRQAVVEALRRIGNIRAVEPLIRALRDEDKDVRRLASEVLGHIGDARALEPLIDALQDESSDVRQGASAALGEIGAPAVEPLTWALRDDNRLVRRGAAESLRQIGDARAVEPLIAALRDEDRDVRWSATDALGQIGDVRALDPLIEALQDEDSGVREAAVGALGKIGDTRAVQPLIWALQGKDELVSEEAARVLEQMSNVVAVEPLMEALRARHMRREAAEALGNIGDTRAVDPLIAALRDGDEAVRQRATEALGQIGDARAVEPLIGVLQDHDTDVRQRAIWALTKIGGAQIVGPLIGTLRDENADVRQRAAEALGQIGAPAVEPLIDVLEDESWWVRQTAAEALGRIGDARAAKPLIDVLEDESWWVRRTAAEALGQAGNAGAVQPLIGALRDENADVRRGAAEALGKIGDSRALPHLERVAREDKGEVFLFGKVADAAREAMERIDEDGTKGELMSELERLRRRIAELEASEAELKQAKQELEQTVQNLRKALGGTVRTLVTLVENRDPYMAGHHRHVSNLARAIATEMDLSTEQIEGIRMAGGIHDLGKIFVPAQILTKPGKLSEIEFDLIKYHPEVGYETSKTADFPWQVPEIILEHHERLDGSGYPRGLSGEKMLVEARILAVADVVEAMASPRSYRPALGVDKALEEMSQNKGILYDPAAVDACLRLFTEKGFRLE